MISEAIVAFQMKYLREKSEDLFRHVLSRERESSAERLDSSVSSTGQACQTRNDNRSQETSEAPLRLNWLVGTEDRRMTIGQLTSCAGN